MKKMKTFYKISFLLILLIYLALLLIFVLKCYEIGEILELSAIFVALFTGVLAVGISDKKNNKIDYNVKVFGNKIKDRETYDLSALSGLIKSNFAKYGDTFYSYKVNFKITNSSDFVLKKPTITIKVPVDVKHPSQDYKTIEIRSNMFNSPDSLQALEYGDTFILSNSNLPYLHPQENIKIWIRMRLDKDDTKPFFLHIALDSENGDGNIKTIKMSPKDILDEME
jgi:hypothetical protein